LRPHHKQQRREGFGGPGKGNAPRPHQPHSQQRGPRVDFDEIQPASNANASPFGHTLSLPRKGPPGNEGAFNPRGNRSGPRGRPGGKGGGGFRGKGGPSNRPRQGGPRGEANGNVAPPREADGNVAPPPTGLPRDED
jgi:translation initiation factor IF-2